MVILTQKNFDTFVESLNHRMTNIESNVNIMKNDFGWMKRIISWQTALLTGIFICMLGVAVTIIAF